MPRAGARSWILRTLGCAAFSVAGCNLILGNDERILVESSSESGSGGTDATTGSDGGASSAGGSGGSSSGAGGSAGASEGGGAGESSAASSVGGAGGAAASTTVGGSGGVGASMGTNSTTTSSTTISSTTTSSTGAPCECTLGDTDPIPMQTACGKCGTAAATRSCGEDCRWGPYGEPGACTNEGVCTPNEPGHKFGHCTNGRWRDDTRTCGNDCQWGPWSEGACQGDATRCTGCACAGTCVDDDTGGATCLWIDCTEAEARAECGEDVPYVCGVQTWEFIEWLPN